MRSNCINGIWTPSAGDAGIDVSAPFGRFGQSGYGRELGVPGLEEFLEIKALQF